MLLCDADLLSECGQEKSLRLPIVLRKSHALRGIDTLEFENPDRGLLGWVLVEKSKMFSSFRTKDGLDEMKCQGEISKIRGAC